MYHIVKHNLAFCVIRLGILDKEVKGVAMKRIIVSAISALFVVMSVGVRADMVSGLGININDSNAYTWSSNPEEDSDGIIHMVAIDITDLYNAKYGTNNDSVFLFGWEDLHAMGADGGLPADWDYQDFVIIMTNVLPKDHTTPEPTTLLICGMGLCGLLAARHCSVKR